MKKISTLAVALITMGSLVTPAQADVVPTSTLPSGYYKIKSAAYSSAEDSKFPWGYMLNDYFLEGNTNHATLLAKSFKENANNYIWKITNDGSTTIAIVNGQGTPIKREDGASGSYTYKEHSTLTPSLSNSDVTTNTYLFSEYLNTPGTGDPNHGYGDGAYKAVAYWNKNTGSTTKWNLEKIDVDANVYTVSIVTTSKGNKPYITRTLTDGTNEYAFNSGFFISEANLDVTSLAASTLEGYDNPDINVDNTAKTVTAYYAKFDDLTALITSARELLNTRGVGYPLYASSAHIQFSSVIQTASYITAASSAKECAEAYTILQNAITNYRSTTTGIQMPEDGKVYRIYAKWADGTKVYAVNDPTKQVNSQYRTTGSKTLPSDNSDIWVMQKVGDYYNIVSANADNLFTYMNQNTATEISTQIITKASGLRIGQLNIAPKANNNQHIVMAKDGSKMGYFTNQSNETHNGWSTEWFFEEVSETDFAGQPVNFAASTDNNNYATLNLPYASKLPEGVTAYKAGNVVDNDLNIIVYKNAGEVLPANTPVLLTADAAVEKTFAPAPYAAAEETGFQGTLSAKAVTATNTYILSKNGGETVKFFALDETNNTINANKAYLVVPAAAGAQALNFNFGNITGIQNAAVEGVNTNAPLFDLSGRRVVKAVKGGIYIQNGKKFVK
uniref:hypothetical protein n=1 Tax=Alloprevotella sp. TaxID=1872471 RepID=UPI0040250A8C